MVKRIEEYLVFTCSCGNTKKYKRKKSFDKATKCTQCAQIGYHKKYGERRRTAKQEQIRHQVLICKCGKSVQYIREGVFKKHKSGEVLCLNCRQVQSTHARWEKNPDQHVADIERARQWRLDNHKKILELAKLKYVPVIDCNSPYDKECNKCKRIIQFKKLHNFKKVEYDESWKCTRCKGLEARKGNPTYIELNKLYYESHKNDPDYKRQIRENIKRWKESLSDEQIAANKEKNREYSRAYYKANREKINKKRRAKE